MYAIIDRLLPIGRETNRPGTPLTPQGIVLHETANPGATAAAHAAYWASAYRGSSTHYVVDPGAIIRLIPESEQAWHAGPTANARYIGIEMCHFDDSAQFEEIWRHTVWLAADICRRHGFDPATAIVTHHWCSLTFGDTNHTDPDAYLAAHGRSIEQFRMEVEKAMADTQGTPILGALQTTVEQAQAWARTRGASDWFIALAPLYWQLGPVRGGVRPEVAYAQAGKETAFGRFGGTIPGPEWHNPCGLKTRIGGSDRDPAAHARFADDRAGVCAHLDHLALYAGAPGYPRADTLDPRHFASIRGVAPTVEQLGGRWAPAADYGVSIVRDYLAGLLATPAQPPTADCEKEQLRQQVAELQAQVAALTAQVAELQSRIDRARAALE